MSQLGGFLIEHIIQDKKIQIYDNVLSDRLVKKWIDFYEKSVSFTLSCKEHASTIGSPVFFNMPLSLKDRTETFEIDSWLLPYIKQFDSDFNFSHFHRSYLNVLTKGDQFNGHSDTSKRYLACLLFMNPYVENGADSGFHIENIYVENKFNRMIVFDGRLFHKAQVPSDDFVRLTLYLGFSFEKVRSSFQYESKHHNIKNNSWFKSVKSI